MKTKLLIFIQINQNPLFQEIEQAPSVASFITNFCKSALNMEPCGTWLIKSNAASVGAFLTILEFDSRPNTLVIRSTNEESPKAFVILLPYFTKECNELRLELFDSFWGKKLNDASSQTITDTGKIATILNSPEL